MEPRVITGILLDADNTLFDFDRAQREALLETIGLRKDHPDSDELISDFKAINDRLWRLHEEGSIGTEEVKVERFRSFLAAHKFKLEADGAAKGFLDLLSAKPYLLAGAHDAIEELHALGLKLCLATNGFSTVQRGRLEASPLADLFDAVVISDEIGIQKPDPAFFQACLDALGLPAGETVFVGDSPSVDILGAKSLGIFSVWINRDGSPYPPSLPSPDIEIASIGDLPRVLGLRI